MSDIVRGVALLLSVLLWSPVAPGLLDGTTPPERALLLYAGALVLALIGCAVLSSLVRAYTPEPEQPAPVDGAGPEAGGVAERRSEDQAAA